MDDKNTLITDQLMKDLMQDKLDQWEKLQIQLQKFPQGMCSQPIGQGERIWKCNDCSHDQQVICFCTSCFKKAKHFGHRIYVYHKSSDEASCDCGDTTQPYISYCEDHSGESQFNQQQLLDAIPAWLQTRLVQFIVDHFKEIFTLLESEDLILQVPQGNEKLNLLLNFLLKLIANSLPLKYAISECLSTNSSDFQTFHTCNNMEALQELQRLQNIKKKQGQQKDEQQDPKQHACICSILENIFRYRFRLAQINEQLAFQIIIKLMINVSYKERLAVTYGKMFKFLQLESYNGNYDQGLYSLYAQFFSFNIMKIIEDNKSIFANNITKSYSKLILFLNKDNEDDQDLISQFMENIWSIITYIIQHPSNPIIWQTMNEFPVMIIKSICHSTFHQFISYDQEYYHLIQDFQILNHVTDIYKQICQMEKGKGLINLLSQLFSFIINDCHKKVTQFRKRRGLNLQNESQSKQNQTDQQMDNDAQKQKNIEQNQMIDNEEELQDESAYANRTDQRLWFTNSQRALGQFLGFMFLNLEDEDLINYYFCEKKIIIEQQSDQQKEKKQNNFKLDISSELIIEFFADSSKLSSSQVVSILVGCVEILAAQFLFVKQKELNASLHDKIAHMINNKNSGESTILRIYKYGNIMLFDRDFSTLQLLCLLLHPDEFISAVQRGIGLAKGDQNEISQLFEQNQLQQQQQLNKAQISLISQKTTEDLMIYFELLATLATNEMSLLNCFVTDQVSQFKKNWCKTAIKNLVLHSFFGRSKQSYTQLQETFKYYQINHSYNLKNEIVQYVNVNHETKQLQLKEEFQKKLIHEPFFFKRSEKHNSELYFKLVELEQIQGKSDVHNNQQYFDSVLGNCAEYYAEDSNYFCNLITNKLIQTNQEANNGISKSLIFVFQNLSYFIKQPKLVKNAFKLLYLVIARYQHSIPLLIQQQFIDLKYNNLAEEHKIEQSQMNKKESLLDGQNAVTLINIDSDLKYGVKRILKLIDNIRDSQNKLRNDQFISNSDFNQRQINVVQDDVDQIKKQKQREKQQQIMQLYQQKQQQFLNQNENIQDIIKGQIQQNNQYSEIIKQSDVETNVCQLCKNTKQNIQSKLLVIPVYLCPDNLHHFYNERNLINYNQKVEQIQKPIQQQAKQHQNIIQEKQYDQMIDETNSITTRSLNVNNDYWYSISTCKHLLHFECGQIVQNKILPEQLISQDEQQSLVENYCSLCNRLSNLHLLYLEPYYKKYSSFELKFDSDLQNVHDQNDLQKQAQNSLKKLINACNQQKQVPSLLEADNGLGNTQLNSSILCESLFQYLTIFSLSTNQDNNFDQLQIFNIQQKTVTFLLDNCFTFGFADFCQSGNLTILRNLYLSNKALMSQELLEAQLKENLLQQTNKIFTERLNGALISKDYLCQKMEQNSYSLDDLFIELMSQLLIVVQICDEKNHQNTCLEALVTVTQLYLEKLNILFSYLIFAKESLIQQQNLNKIEITAQMLQDFFFLDQQNNQSKIQNNEYHFMLLHGYLLPYYRLIIGFFAGTVIRIEDNLLEQLSVQFNSCTDEIKAFQSVFGQQIINELSPISFKKCEQFIMQLNSLFQDNSHEIRLLNFIEKNPCQKFNNLHYILQADIMQMHEKYFFNMCSLCNDYPKTVESDLCICLICGFLLCSKGCDPSKKPYQQMNLMNHSDNIHAGNSLFFIIQKAQIIVISFGKAVILALYLYNDQVGQEFINRVNINWKDYTLSKPNLLMLQNEIQRRQLPQKLRKTIYDLIRSNKPIDYNSKNKNPI